MDECMFDSIFLRDSQGEWHLDSLVGGGEASITVFAETGAKGEYLSESLVVKTRFQDSMAPYHVLFMLSVLVLLSFFRSSFFRYVSTSFVAAFNLNLARKQLESKNVLHARGRIMLFFVFLFLLSYIVVFLLMTVSSSAMFPAWNIYQLSVGLFLSLSALFVLRYIVLKWIGRLFLADDLVHEYLFHTNSICVLLGAVLLPVVIVLPFLPAAFLIGLSYAIGTLFLLAFVVLVLRLFVVIMGKNISFFYLFLYLCTLEILPVLVIFKIVSGVEI